MVSGKVISVLSYHLNLSQSFGLERFYSIAIGSLLWQSSVASLKRSSLLYESTEYRLGFI